MAAVDLHAALDNPDAFGLWRRDTLVEAGGFSAATSGAGLDLALRLHEGAQGGTCRILTMAHARQAEGPRTLVETMRRRARWSRAWFEAAWRSPRAIFGAARGRGLVDRLTSGVAAVLEAWLVIALPIGILSGVVGWLPALLIAGTVALARGTGSNAALLVAGRRLSGMPPGRPRASVCVGALEFPVYAPIGLVAGFVGASQFLVGRRRPAPTEM